MLGRLAYGVLKGIRNLTAVGFISVGSGVLAEAPAEPVTLAALGDSLTQGFGLPPEDGFVPQLQRFLDDEGLAVTVVNAGVSGDTTAGGLARVGWTLGPEVDAMIVALGGNDFLRGIDPSVSRANLRGILVAAADAEVPVFLVGIEASANYGAAFQQAFNSMYPDLAQEFGTGLFPSFLAPLAADGNLSAALATYMQTDGIHPNREGVARIVAVMGPEIRDWLRSLD